MLALCRKPYILRDLPKAVAGESVIPPRYAESINHTVLRKRQSQVSEFHAQELEVESGIVSHNYGVCYET